MKYLNTYAQKQSLLSYFSSSSISFMIVKLIKKKKFFLWQLKNACVCMCFWSLDYTNIIVGDISFFPLKQVWIWIQMLWAVGFTVLIMKIDLGWTS